MPWLHTHNYELCFSLSFSVVHSLATSISFSFNQSDEVLISLPYLYS